MSGRSYKKSCISGSIQVGIILTRIIPYGVSYEMNGGLGGSQREDVVRNHT
jgi:hypothetical protein